MMPYLIYFIPNISHQPVNLALFNLSITHDMFWTRSLRSAIINLL